MDPVDNDLLAAVVILQMLAHQKHIWSNELATANATANGDEITRIKDVLDAIELETARQHEQIKFIGNFLVRPVKTD